MDDAAPRSRATTGERKEKTTREERRNMAGKRAGRERALWLFLLFSFSPFFPFSFLLSLSCFLFLPLSLYLSSFASLLLFLLS